MWGCRNGSRDEWSVLLGAPLDRLPRVKAVMATSPGHLCRPNEDFVGAVPEIVVLLDGAGIPGTEEVCCHGVSWYSRTLGGTLLASMAREGRTDPVQALADGIDRVAAQHRHTCDIAHPNSPQASVAMIKFEDDRADYLVLADAFVVLDRVDGGSQAITDPREVMVRRECASPLHGLAVGTVEYQEARLSAVESLRARRNQPGGYWIAKDDPHAAAQAVTGSTPLADLNGAALLSNGASRIVDPYLLAEWPAVMEALRTSGPEVLLQGIRRAESEAGAGVALPGYQSPDDATAAYCTPFRRGPDARICR